MCNCWSQSSTRQRQKRQPTRRCIHNIYIQLYPALKSFFRQPLMNINRVLYLSLTRPALHMSPSFSGYIGEHRANQCAFNCIRGGVSGANMLVKPRLYYAGNMGHPEFLLKREPRGRNRETRRGGSGEEGGGTLASPTWSQRGKPWTMGDASVPTPHNPTPAPTDMKPLHEPGGEFRADSCLPYKSLTSTAYIELKILSLFLGSNQPIFVVFFTSI